MGKKSELRIINEIETTSSTTLECEELKQEKIIKNVKFLRKYGYTKSWWYQNVLPIILKRHNINNRLKVSRNIEQKSNQGDIE